MSAATGPGLRYGYGSNGFTSHRLHDAAQVLADLGYDGIALTPDVGHLDPYADDAARQVERFAALLDRLGLAVTVETGARYLLDPRRKHAPTLLHDEPAPRLDYLERSARIAADLGSPTVSLWSGVAPAGPSREELWHRLVDGCLRALEIAERHGLVLAFEPEPGMFVEDLAGLDDLRRRLGSPPKLGTALDIGHCRCLEDLAPPDCVRAAGPHLAAVQIEDMRRGVHEHLEFGHGEIDFPPVLQALKEVGYRGLVGVELPRHGHDAPGAAERALRFLQEHSLQEHSLQEQSLKEQRPHEHGARVPRSPMSTPEAPTPGPDRIVQRLRGALSPDAAAWLDERLAAVRAEPARALAAAFPAAARHCGSEALADTPPWLVCDAARLALLDAAPLEGGAFAAEVGEIYRYGDASEKRSVLRCLDPLEPKLGEAALWMVADALRGNDTTLIAASLGPYAARRLDDHAFRQAVLKCLFTGVPLAEVHGAAERADAELARMACDYAVERVAAGREVPTDALPLLAGHPEQVERLRAETRSDIDGRAAAARRALEELES